MINGFYFRFLNYSWWNMDCCLISYRLLFQITYSSFVISLITGILSVSFETSFQKQIQRKKYKYDNAYLFPASSGYRIIFRTNSMSESCLESSVNASESLLRSGQWYLHAARISFPMFWINLSHPCDFSSSQVFVSLHESFGCSRSSVVYTQYELQASHYLSYHGLRIIPGTRLLSSLL